MGKPTHAGATASSWLRAPPWGILGPALSRENVELVMWAVGAAVRRPRPDFETVNALYHEDHELVGALQRGLGEGPLKGAQGFKSWLEEQGTVMSWETDLESAVDVGPDTVLAVATSRFAGASSGLGEVRRMWLVLTIATGKIARSEISSNRPRRWRRCGG